MIYEILSRYYGMSLDEFKNVINGDIDKLYRFAYDYLYNHN
jgi:hypothetical protein